LWVSSKSLVAQFDWVGVAASMVANCGFWAGSFIIFVFFPSLFCLSYLLSLNILYFIFFAYKYLFLSFVYGS
jgi:hypothetical protein